jgi:HSP20 family molecular chaperone IbpA
MLNTLTLNSSRFPFSQIMDEFFEDNVKSFDLSSAYWTESKNGDSVLVLTIPGLDKKDAKISVKDDVLFVKGSIENEFYKKEVNKQYLLPEGTDTSKVRVSLKNGVAIVTAPKLEQQKPRQIDIE